MSQSPSTGFGSRWEFQMSIELWIFFYFYVLLKDSFLQEEPQHILMSVLIQVGE